MKINKLLAAVLVAAFAMPVLAQPAPAPAGAPAAEAPAAKPAHKKHKKHAKKAKKHKHKKAKKTNPVPANKGAGSSGLLVADRTAWPAPGFTGRFGGRC